MSKVRIFVAGGAAALALGVGVAWTPPVFAASETPLDVTPGLWEMTTQLQSGAPPPLPPDVEASMTPEQKQKYRAAMEAMMNRQSRPHVSRVCITAEELKGGFAKSHRKDCKSEVLKSTSKELDIKITCTGETKAAGTVHYEALNSVTISGLIDMNVSHGPQTMEVKNHVRGKWLAVDCGDLKPSK